MLAAAEDPDGFGVDRLSQSIIRDVVEPGGVAQEGLEQLPAEYERRGVCDGEGGVAVIGSMRAGMVDQSRDDRESALHLSDRIAVENAACQHDPVPAQPGIIRQQHPGIGELGGLAGEVIEYGRHKFVLGAEVPEYQPVVHARPLGDVSDRRRGRAAFGEQIRRVGEHR